MESKNNKLQAKDLINVGIFTAIYFVIFFAGMMLGYIPIFIPLLGLVCPILCGIPFMLYLTKVKKFGMVSGGADICPPYSQGDICPPEIRDKRLDIRDKSIENRESESARAYGRYQNVFLTDEELADLQASFPTVWGQYIEKLSEYMASTGKRYQSHAATIRRWAGEDAKKAAPPTRNRDYSVKEDETV